MRVFLQWLLALALLMASGIQVARSTHEVRSLHAQLQKAQRTQDDGLAEHSRLLLERAALSAYQNVERLAETELHMQFPHNVERIER
ncbi:MAG: cell division protein FtsL [Pseudomonadales bacterium]|nr:cell division protein FtsL [Pseudomonadales bacterium]